MGAAGTSRSATMNLVSYLIPIPSPVPVGCYPLAVTRLPLPVTRRPLPAARSLDVFQDRSDRGHIQ
jgi:hypothetical protein